MTQTAGLSTTLEAMLSGQDIAEAGLVDWRQIARTIRARFDTKAFATGLDLVAAIGEAAEAADHHPDVDLRYTHVNVTLTSHDTGGVTERDVELARTISEIAASRGIAADPAAVQGLAIALDTPRPDELARFWAAAFDADVHGGDEPWIEDQGGWLPAMWFQRSDDDRIRFHLDVHVAPEQVQARIDAIVAAGGSLVSDRFAPSWWILADPDGNEVCVCTWQDHD